MTIDQSAFQNLNPVPTSLLVFGIPTLPPRGEVGRSSGRVGLFCVENCTNEQSALPSPGLKARLSQRESMVPCESLRHRCLVLKCAPMTIGIHTLHGSLLLDRRTHSAS
jgi:hypothetical protein